jgi:hypothetical protein
MENIAARLAVASTPVPATIPRRKRNLIHIAAIPQFAPGGGSI